MGKTTKGDLIAGVSEELHIPVRDAHQIVDTIVTSMVDALSRGEGIELRDFGSFHVKQYGSYEGRNPKSGQKITVKPKKLPVFRVGKFLRETVNEENKKN